jgi:hypothetical protein
MDFTSDFTHVAGKTKKHGSFPLFGDVPVVAVDFDGTLAEYSSWKGPEHTGAPRPHAIWALRCFQRNGWEVEIWTNRGDTGSIWKWVGKYASGLVQRINETRVMPGNNSTKPKVDIFIDDKSEYWFGRELDWLEVIARLKKRGLLPD